MKKFFALLLALCILFALSACGASEVAESTESAETAAESTQSEQPVEPEKTYVQKAVSLLVSTTEEGIQDYMLKKYGPFTFSGSQKTEYSYDEYGNVSDTIVHVTDNELSDYLNAVEYSEFGDEGKYTIEYDDAGNLLSVTKPGGMSYTFMNGGRFSTTETGTFENGLLTRIVCVWDQGETTSSEVTREFHPNGNLKRETTKNLVVPGFYSAYSFDSPLVCIREFNEDGRCTLLHIEDINEDLFVLTVDETRWDYDSAGNPVKMVKTSGQADNVPLDGIETAEVCSAEMKYDSENRMVSGTKTADGISTAYTYSYDAGGRLTGIVRKSGDTEIVSEYEYNEEGFLAADHRSKNGAPDGDVLYNWEKDDKAKWTGTVSSGDPKLSVFRFDDLNIYPDRIENGTPVRETRCTLIPSPITLEPVYFDQEIESEYETQSILVEIDPDELAAAEASAADLASYYPILSESYCGVPVPVPSGAERLIKAVTVPSSYNLEIVSEFEYSPDGTLLRTVDYFDPVSSYRYSMTQKADEQGRLIEYNPTETQKCEYKYGDDPATYTLIFTYDGNSRETIVKLEEEVLPAWIGKSIEELIHYNNLSLNEDGLVEQYDIQYSTGEVKTVKYTYQAETYDNGALKAVLRYDEGYDYGYPILEFDPAGYLTTYYSPNYYTVTYTYG